MQASSDSSHSDPPLAIIPCGNIVGPTPKDAITKGLENCIEQQEKLVRAISSIREQAELSLDGMTNLLKERALHPTTVERVHRPKIVRVLQPILQQSTLQQAPSRNSALQEPQLDPPVFQGRASGDFDNIKSCHNATADECLIKRRDKHTGLSPGCSTHFFLSHYQKNGGDQVATLQLELEAIGFLSWLDNKAEKINTEGMMQGIDEACVFLLFLTKGALSRPYVQMEVRHALTVGKPIVLVHEDDKRKGAFDFDKSEIPSDLHHVVDNIESIPYRRRRWEANAMLRRIIASGGFELETHSESGAHQDDSRWPASIKPRFEKKKLKTSGSGVKGNLSSDSQREVSDRQIACSMPPTLWSTYDPYGGVAIFLDTCSLVILLYEVTVGPYLIAHTWNNLSWEKWVSTVTGLFWLVMLGVTAKMGFVKNGVLEMNPRECLLHYLMGWFLFDACLVVLDIFCVIENFTSNSLVSVDALRTGLLVRILRVLRCARILKIFALLRSATSFWVSQAVLQFLGPLGLLLLALLLAHFFACARLGLIASGMHHVAPEYLSLMNMYVGRILSNATTQSDRFGLEVGLSMLSVIFGALINSCCVSTVGLCFASSYGNKLKVMEKIHKVTEFLKRHKVPRTTAQRVLRGCWTSLAHTEEEASSGYEALLCVPPLLHRELLWELLAQEITRHPFFLLWSRIAIGSLQDFCSVGIQDKSLDKNEMIFEVGSEANSSYVVRQGLVVYDLDLSIYVGVDESSVKREVIQQGAWISEAALWSKWFHTGTAITMDTCDLMVLDAVLFMKHAQKHISMREIANEYGACFARRIVESTEAWPSDVSVLGTDFAEIVVALSPDVHSRIGCDAIAMLKSTSSFQFFKYNAALRDLEKEVLDGRSILLQTRVGVVERITSVSVLRLFCEDGGRLLYQIAKVHDENISISCRMIGGKVKRGEKPLATAKRLTEEIMNSLKDDIRFGNAVLDVQHTKSQVYGVDTKYFRTVQYASLSGARRAWAGTTQLNVLGVLRRGSVRSDMAAGDRRLANMSPSFVGFLNQHFDDVFMDDSGVYAWVDEVFFNIADDMLSIPGNANNLATVLSIARSQEFDGALVVSAASIRASCPSGEGVSVGI
eukprot:TRINITY_DN9518_c0_g1_i1.p1 TRINITY_DN9518_c0_g1~~TRINITY_DN9518_c0_g1_i1.p1  ORF type:complete len:1125 (-),score=165.59 TRINITY_DN9518_c0_g1_i1:80-3418(-)